MLKYRILNFLIHLLQPDIQKVSKKQQYPLGSRFINGKGGESIYVCKGKD